MFFYGESAKVSRWGKGKIEPFLVTSKTNLGEKDNLMTGHTVPAFVSLN